MDAYRYVGGLKSFSFEAITSNDDLFQDKMRQEFVHKVHVDVQRPNKLYIKVRGDIKNKSFYLNGETFTMMGDKSLYYGTIKVPNSIDKTLDFLFENYDIKTPLANLLYTDLDKRIGQKNEGYYFGTTTVDGTLCHHLGFSNEDREFQVWIEKNKTPLVKKFVFIDKSGALDLRSTTLLRWNLKPSFKKNHFIFTAPKKARKISVIQPALEGSK